METEHTAHLWRMGNSAAQIAQELNETFYSERTRNMVISKLRRMGLLGTTARAKRKSSKARSSVADVIAGARSRTANFGRTYPLPPDEPIPATAVTLEDRQPHQCAWPVNHGSPFLFCGARRGVHRAFCDHHAAVAAFKE